MPTQITAFGIFSHTTCVTIFRTAAAAQDIILQGNDGTNRLLTTNLSRASCISECYIATLHKTSVKLQTSLQLLYSTGHEDMAIQVSPLLDLVL